MNKLKNNVTRSIPNLHASEIKSDYGKILNSLKPNELLEVKSTKNVDLSLKNKINSSIRENISSLSSDRQQPVKIKKIDIKVATIVELIKQDLLPMLNIQNQRIEKLEKKLKVKQDFEQELEQKESSLEIAKRVNSAMEKDFSNLSVSVDEVKKNLTSLDNFVKYQFLKTKHKHEEDSNIKTLQSKITTELNEQNQQTFTQIQEYMAIQLHEIKDWINKSQNDYKSQIEVKLEQMQIQFYEFMYQPIESIKQLQIQQIQTLKSVNNCFCNQTKQELCFTLNCGHAYHQDCLMNDLYDDKKECRVCQKKIKLGDLRNNCLEKEFIDWVYKQQLKQLLQENQLRMQSCLKCGFYWVSENGKQVDDCSQCKES